MNTRLYCRSSFVEQSIIYVNRGTNIELASIISIHRVFLMFVKTEIPAGADLRELLGTKCNTLRRHPFRHHPKNPLKSRFRLL